MAAGPALPAPPGLLLTCYHSSKRVTPQRYTQVKSLFQLVLDQPADQRQQFLEKACGGDRDLYLEVRSLLLADSTADNFLSQPALTPVSQILADAARETDQPPPSHIGPYAIQRQLGTGGMGTVYLASRADQHYSKLVALKVIRHGMEQDRIVQRFRRERQIVASLDHPNIARLLDGGAAEDGRPYFVMEYVEGIPIDTYCDERKLSTEDRLRLFSTVCAAVHYAHQNLVVHRDLKPGNILVSNEGVVKLLDFGIAKQLGPASMELTTAEGTPLTPAYASPEQFTGRADARSDIYTLGVILYLMITGKLPDQGTTKPPSESVREDVTRTQETTKQLKKRVMGDLDMVVLKAMNRESRLRYATAQELSDDLGRFMSGQPVLARASTGISPKLLALVAAGLVVILGGGAAVYFMTQDKPEAAVVEPQKPTEPSVVAEVPKSVEPPKTDPTLTASQPTQNTQPAPVPQTQQPQTQVVKTQAPPPQQQQQPQHAPAPIPAAPVAPQQPEGLDDARDKYAAIAGKVAATEQLFNKVKSDLEAKGMSIRADSLQRVISMKLNLEQAKSDLDRMNVAGALKNLTAAEAQAARVSKEFGR